MPHEYRNYAHLEGVLVLDPVVLETLKGTTVTFKLSVGKSEEGMTDRW